MASQDKFTPDTRGNEKCPTLGGHFNRGIFRRWDSLHLNWKNARIGIGGRATMPPVWWLGWGNGESNKRRSGESVLAVGDPTHSRFF